MIRVLCDKHVREFTALAGGVYTALGLSGEGYAEVLFVSDAEIREVNARERGIDQATDVLSFPTLHTILPLNRENYPADFDESEGAVSLGSILLSTAAVQRQAAEYGHTERRERAYLFVHGLLHLLGFDHQTDEQKAAMRAAEEKVLLAAGITREETKE